MNLKNTLKAFKLNESTISMFLGVMVIIVVGILVINFFGGKKQGELIPAINTEDLSSDKLSTTHTVNEGEDLWRISEKYYGSGYNWTDIALENNINNPENIEVGQKLTIPDVEAKIATAETITQTATPKPTKTQVQGNILVETGNEEVHVVKDGENLWEIAEEKLGSGYDWVKIAKANNLENPGLIEAGQELTLPISTERDELTTSGTETEKDTQTDTTYKVEKGDNLWEIAVKAYGDGYRWADIAKANGLDNPNIIHHGNELKLPR